MKDALSSSTVWVRRLREPSVVLGTILAAAWLAPLVSGWSMVLQSVLGIGAVLLICRSWLRDRVAPAELGFRVDNLLTSSILLVVTVLPLAAVHLLVGKETFRWNRVPTYFVWALLQQFIVVAGAWRHFPRPTTSRKGLEAAALAAAFFALAHAPNTILMELCFAGELVWLMCFARFRNLFAVALAHSLAAVAVQQDLVPGCLSSLKVGLHYWWR